MYKAWLSCKVWHSSSSCIAPRLIPSICVCIAPLAETEHKKSELLLVICEAIAEGGGDMILVVCVPVDVTVESETIGSAAIAENDTHQKVKTTNPAIKLLRSLVDITYGVLAASRSVRV